MKRINVTNLAFSLVLILMLALGTACSLPLGNGNSAQAGALADSGNTSLIHSAWSVPSVESQSSVLPSIADVVAAVKPSVVAIDTQVTFNVFRRSFTEEGAGSGWIIDEDGIIVTNSHVVAGAESISVTLDDGRTFTVDPNTVVTDPLTDLAVLRINAENLPAADIGDSSALRVGDWVVAIGNSLGLGISATSGIVSGLEISLPVSSGQTLYDLIQTDAAINPGNSGGPLVNMKGEVIGITSVKIAAVGVEGLGYAISINEAIPIIEELITSR
jgi:S1-C subfamily serine protease